MIVQHNLPTMNLTIRSRAERLADRDRRTLHELLRARRCRDAGEAGIWWLGHDAERDIPTLEREARPAMQRIIYALAREAWR